jgi:hypothetical protein
VYVYQRERERERERESVKSGSLFPLFEIFKTALPLKKIGKKPHVLFYSQRQQQQQQQHGE